MLENNLWPLTLEIIIPINASHLGERPIFCMHGFINLDNVQISTDLRLRTVLISILIFWTPPTPQFFSSAPHFK